MHHLTKKKYLALKEVGMTAEELKAEMLAGGVEEAEADALIQEAYNESPEQDGEKEKEKPAVKSEKAEKQPKATQAVQTANIIYEEWKMSLSHESGSPVMEKLKKIKEVKLTPDRAERLNEHAENRKVKYFLKQN